MIAAASSGNLAFGLLSAYRDLDSGVGALINEGLVSSP